MSIEQAREWANAAKERDDAFVKDELIADYLLALDVIEAAKKILGYTRFHAESWDALDAAIAAFEEATK